MLLLTLLYLYAASVPTIDQSLAMQGVSGAEISPDGKYIAYVATQTNWEDNEFVSQIWISVTATGERYRLTSGKKSSTGARWSPDSHRIAFTSDRDGKQQIYLISPSGGEASALTTEDNGAGAPVWSPDGAWIAFTSTGPDPKSKKERKDKYGEYYVVESEYEMAQKALP
jgi:Tol biopolymer transport system component